MEKVRTGKYIIQYTGKDITASIAPYVLSVTYTDNAHGKSDEIEITVEDSLGRWRGSWFPGKGDTLTLQLGYEGEPMLPCGSFELDEFEVSGPPDQMVMKGLGTNIKKSLRQANTAAYEGVALKTIAKRIAEKHGFELVEDSVPDITAARITQNNEKDLAFLKRLAEKYGYTFKVTDNKLVFYDIEELEFADVVHIVKRQDLLRYSLRDKTHAIYKSCTVSYHDPSTKELVEYSKDAEGVVTGDTLKLTERVENKEQAMEACSSALAKANGQETEGTITVPGTPKLVGGSNIELQGMAQLDGVYFIEASKHTVDRSGGYVTELSVRRLGTKSKHDERRKAKG